MKLPENWAAMAADGKKLFSGPPAGNYKAQLTGVKNQMEKNALMVTWSIIDGEYQGKKVSRWYNLGEDNERRNIDLASLIEMVAKLDGTIENEELDEKSIIDKVAQIKVTTYTKKDGSVNSQFAYILSVSESGVPF